MCRFVAAMLLVFGCSPLVASKHRPVQQKFSPEAAAARDLALGYLQEHAAKYGLTDATKELRVKNIHSTKARRYLVRFEQIHDGVPVLATSLLADVRDGVVARVDAGGIERDLEVNAVPHLKAQDAVKIAFQAMRIGADHDEPEVTLLILPRTWLERRNLAGTGDRLVWEVAVVEHSDPGRTAAYFIDAHSGEVVWHESLAVPITHYQVGSSLRGAHVDTVRSLVSTPRFRRDGSLRSRAIYLQDVCHGNGHIDDDCGSYSDGIRGVVVQAGNWVGDARGRITPRGRPFEKSSLFAVEFGDGLLGSANAETPAADAFVSMNTTFDQLLSRFGQFGLNGNNDPMIYTLVRTGYNTSVWETSCSCIMAGAGDAQFYDMVSLDVMAHEIGHGLSQYGPNLDLVGEPGKLAEANPDIFAFIVTSYYQKPGTIPHWIGEEVFRANWPAPNVFEPTVAFRYMDDPVKSPGAVACYYPAIGNLNNHDGTGPAIHMFYLLTHGGTSKCNDSIVTAIGLETAAAVWYEAFSNLQPRSDFADFRQQFFNASQMIAPGPSIITSSVVAAFDAVDIPN